MPNNDGSMWGNFHIGIVNSIPALIFFYVFRLADLFKDNSREKLLFLLVFNSLLCVNPATFGSWKNSSIFCFVFVKNYMFSIIQLKSNHCSAPYGSAAGFTGPDTCEAMFNSIGLI